MSRHVCCICGTQIGNAIYSSGQGRSLTSLCQIHSSPTLVYACRQCGHSQSDPIANIDDYYDSNYDILVESVEEDQIYQVVNGQVIYRTAHQVDTFRKKVLIAPGMNLLDYGCAKSSTIRRLSADGVIFKAHLFDVSSRYVHFWSDFVDPSRWAVNTMNPLWISYFDIVTSFFSLEHIPNPAKVLNEIAETIKPGGFFYAIVPNVFSNTADFIVVDHCNHFTVTSLATLIANAGLDLQEIDSETHRGAHIVIARKPIKSRSLKVFFHLGEIESVYYRLMRIADFWEGASERVRIYESSLQPFDEIGVYGAGFYAAFISASLTQPGRVVCYLDQNPHLHGKFFLDRPIVPPAALPKNITKLLIGLNPAHAREIITDITELNTHSLDCFYI